MIYNASLCPCWLFISSPCNLVNLWPKLATAYNVSQSSRLPNSIDLSFLSAIGLFLTIGTTHPSCDNVAASLPDARSCSTLLVSHCRNAAQRPVIDSNVTRVGQRHGTCKSRYLLLIVSSLISCMSVCTSFCSCFSYYPWPTTTKYNFIRYTCNT